MRQVYTWPLCGQWLHRSALHSCHLCGYWIQSIFLTDEVTVSPSCTSPTWKEFSLCSANTGVAARSIGKDGNGFKFFSWFFSLKSLRAGLVACVSALEMWDQCNKHLLFWGWSLPQSGGLWMYFTALPRSHSACSFSGRICDMLRSSKDCVCRGSSSPGQQGFLQLFPAAFLFLLIRILNISVLLFFLSVV